MRRAIISRAWRWPMIRCSRVSASCSTVSISFLTMRPTGMPVQSPTTDATAWPSTVGRMRGWSPCKAARSFCAAVSWASRASRSMGGAAGAAGAAGASAALALPAPLAGFAAGEATAPPLAASAAASSWLSVPSTLAASPRSWRRKSRILSTMAFSLLQRSSSPARRSFSLASLAWASVMRWSAPLTPMARSRSMMPISVSRAWMRPAAVLDLGRDRVLADGHPRAGRVEQADRLVGQLAGGNVAMRELDRGLQGLVEDLDAVVLLQYPGHAAHHEQGLGLARLADLDDLEAAGEGRILLDVLLVLGPGGGRDGAQLAARQRRLEQVGRVAGAGRAAGADQGVRLVDEQDDGLG